MPSNLSLYEASLIAGLPNAPSVYELSNNSRLTYQRQNMVIEALEKYGYIDYETMLQIKSINKEKI